MPHAKSNFAPHRDKFGRHLISDGLQMPPKGNVHNNGFAGLYTLTGAYVGPIYTWVPGQISDTSFPISKIEVTSGGRDINFTIEGGVLKCGNVSPGYWMNAPGIQIYKGIFKNLENPKYDGIGKIQIDFSTTEPPTSQAITIGPNMGSTGIQVQTLNTETRLFILHEDEPANVYGEDYVSYMSNVSTPYTLGERITYELDLTNNNAPKARIIKNGIILVENKYHPREESTYFPTPPELQSAINGLPVWVHRNTQIYEIRFYLPGL